MIITSIVKQKKDNKYNIHIDGNYCFSVDYEDLKEYKIEEDKEYDDESIRIIINNCQYKKAYNTALRALSYRAQSESEIRKKLKEKQYYENVIEQVIIKLRELKYLDDIEFSRMWIEDRKNIKPAGKRRIAEELKSKGVEYVIIDNILAASDINDLDTALLVIKKKIKGNKYELNDPKIYSRTIRYLLYRGIDYETAKRAIHLFINEDSYLT